jgi:hypothetical protein
LAPGARSTTSWLSVVHDESSFGVCPAAPVNDPSVMLAAAEYTATRTGAGVVLETSTRRWMTAPGAR